MSKIIVIGGGPAGLMAAVRAAALGSSITLLEKMPVVGKKMLITGKGRCNITNDCDLPELISNIPGNGQFLYSALQKFTNQDIRDFLAQWDVPTKVERGGRVFPVSDRAQDVVQAFLRALQHFGGKICTSQAVRQILTDDSQVTGVVTADGKTHVAAAVILAVGGASYPATGSTGDGYQMAQALGHSIIPLKPSLVPLEVAEEWISDLQGLSLKNVAAKVVYEDKVVADEFGEMLFTHFGLSGPIILSLSKKVAELLNRPQHHDILLEINLKPALTVEVLDKRLQRDFEKFSRKQIKNGLSELLPHKLINVIIDLAHIDPDKFVHQITKEERGRLLQQLQHLTFSIIATRPVSEAIVTAGGINTKEINPKTMESKLVKSLYFAGEVIDIDGYTGGYNLQAAFSTGFVAGSEAASV